MNPSSSLSSQRGAGALIVVLTLFFITSLVAAYSSRNMIFEQKTSANQYRSTQAFEAAQAGVDWAVAMLNSGRITNTCQPSSDSGDNSFRQRYLTIDATGGILVNPVLSTPLRTSCVRTASGWSCSCPVSGDPVLSAPGGANPAPAFRLRFESVGRPGVVRLISQGCTRLDVNCLEGNVTAGDAAAAIRVQIALKGAVVTAPAAALTVRGDVLAGTAFTAVNDNATASGLTINSGGPQVTGPVLSTVGGGIATGSWIDGDTTLSARSAEGMFASVLGMGRDTWRQLPSTLVRNCGAGECDAAALATLVANNPGRTLWLDGDVDLATSADLGSAAAPVSIVVNGNLTTNGATAVRIYGQLYVTGTAATPPSLPTWTLAGSGLEVIGAAVAEGHVGGSGTPTFRYDADVLTRLRLASGAFVPVPGSWRDF